jgi:acyl carrier protein
LIKLVEQILARNSITRLVSIDDQLTEVGLSSVDMVNLMLAVEAEFDLTIPAPEITPGEFSLHLDHRGLGPKVVNGLKSCSDGKPTML